MSGCGMVTRDGERLAGRQTILEEVWVEDGHPGGTTNRVQGEDGRSSQDGDRRDLDQEEPGRTQAKVTMVAMEELTEGGAMVVEWPTTPWGRPTAAEQVVVEPESATESRRARVKLRIRRAKAEPEASVSEV